MPWDNGVFIPPPTPAPGAMTAGEQMARNAPPLSAEEFDAHAAAYERMWAASNVARAAIGAAIGAAPPDPYNPDDPMNNSMPAASSVTSFTMSGRPGTAFQTINSIANIIPRSSYPLDNTSIYPGMQRVLTDEEMAYLNTKAGYPA